MTVWWSSKLKLLLENISWNLWNAHQVAKFVFGCVNRNSPIFLHETHDCMWHNGHHIIWTILDRKLCLCTRYNYFKAIRSLKTKSFQRFQILKQSSFSLVKLVFISINKVDIYVIMKQHDKSIFKSLLYFALTFILQTFHSSSFSTSTNGVRNKKRTTTTEDNNANSIWSLFLDNHGTPIFWLNILEFRSS